MIEHIGWIKSFSGFLKAVLDRLTLSVGRRKPKLYVHFQPITSVWCIGNLGQPPSAANELMHVVCRASFTHDDPKQALVIIDAYPVGTKTQVAALLEFAIPPGAVVKKQISTMVAPVIGKKGKPWTGKLIFIDQFLRKHKTDKITFKWVGGPNP